MNLVRLKAAGKLAVWLILFYQLSACTVIALKPPASAPWAARQSALNALQNWTLSGRIGITDNKDGKKNGWHAGIRWIQQDRRYAIDLAGPLGQGRVAIRGNPQGIRVQTADGRILSAGDPDRLLEEVIGSPIPISGLLYWVRGLPDPVKPGVLAGDEQGYLTRLEQDGWIIEYPGYTQVAELHLPERILARQDELQVKLIIKQWNLQR